MQHPILKEVHKLKVPVFKNKALKNIFEFKMNEVVRGSK
jgi:hypothetical protein